MSGSDQPRTAASMAIQRRRRLRTMPAGDAADEIGIRSADLRLVPVALAVWAGAWLGTEWTWLTIVGVGLGTGVLVAGAVTRSWLLRAAGITLLVGIALGGIRGWQASSSDLRELADSGSAGILEAEIAGEPRLVEDAGWRSSWTARVRAVQFVQGAAAWAGAEQVVLQAPLEQPWRELVVGTRIRTAVTLGTARGRSADVAIARARGQPTVISEPDALLHTVERLRAGLRAAVADRPPVVRGLVPALVVGDTSAIDADLVADFRATGLTHLTAVSGANLTILLAFVGLASRWLGVRGLWLRAVAVAAVVGFVMLCRAEPSVLRAAAMGLVSMAAIGRGRGVAGLRPLAAAVFAIVVLDPWMSRSWGFVLSVLATGGIMLWCRPWADHLQTWMPRPLAEALTLPIAAQVATQPVVSLLSGQVSFVGIAANLLTGSLVGPATVLGFLAAGASTVWPPLAALLGWAASWFAQGIVWIAQFGAALPGAGLSWPTSPPALVLLTLGCLGTIFLVPVVFRRAGAFALAVLTLGGVCLVGPPRPGWPPASWQVAVCDVGQGDALVINVGARAAFLVDTGPAPQPVSACLRGLGVSAVPLVFLTHFHADHVEGLQGVLDTGSVRDVVVGPAGHTALGVRSELEGVIRSGGEVRAAAAGDRFSAGGVEVRILAADPELRGGGSSEGESTAENDASLAMLITAGGISMLIAGDREEGGQDRLAGAGIPSVDVLAVPHHGSGRQSARFLRTASPAVAVVSVGERNPYGHPSPKTLSALTGLGATVFRTDQHGTIAIGRGRHGLEVTTER